MRSRDDARGRVTHADGAESVYAGAHSTPFARADGQGGLLAQGYWIQHPGDGYWSGPYSTRLKALKSRDSNAR